MLPVSVAWSSSGMLTTGRIAYQREGADRSAQRGRSMLSTREFNSVRFDTLVNAWLSEVVGLLEEVDFQSTPKLSFEEGGRSQMVK